MEEEFLQTLSVNFYRVHKGVMTYQKTSSYNAKVSSLFTRAVVSNLVLTNLVSYCFTNSQVKIPDWKPDKKLGWPMHTYLTLNNTFQFKWNLQENLSSSIVKFSKSFYPRDYIFFPSQNGKMSWNSFTLFSYYRMFFDCCEQSLKPLLHSPTSIHMPIHPPDFLAKTSQNQSCII